VRCTTLTTRTGLTAGPSFTGDGGSPGRPLLECSLRASPAAAQFASSSSAPSSCPPLFPFSGSSLSGHLASRCSASPSLRLASAATSTGSTAGLTATHSAMSTSSLTPPPPLLLLTMGSTSPCAAHMAIASSASCRHTKRWPPFSSRFALWASHSALLPRPIWGPMWTASLLLTACAAPRSRKRSSGPSLQAPSPFIAVLKPSGDDAVGALQAVSICIGVP